MRSTIDPRATRRWAVLRHHLVVAVVGAPEGDLAFWADEVHRITGAQVLVAPGLAHLGGAHRPWVEISEIVADAESFDVGDLRAWTIQNHRHFDLAIVDARHRLPEPFALLRLHHAVNEYEGVRGSVGIAVPRLVAGDRTLSGWEWDVSEARWVVRDPSTSSTNHGVIPRYVLRAPLHGAVLSWRVLDVVRVAPRTETSRDPSDQFAAIQRDAWHAHLHTLAFSSVTMTVTEIPRTPDPQPEDLAWLGHRRTTDENGRVRVRFLLPYTGISGGIRTVFEQSDRLLELGLDVEIWSLGGDPDWLDHRVRVRTFRSYHDLLILLRDEDAIKVATWWESTQIVWLASVVRGVAVNYVQEFETWFYPDNPVARDAVAASYRREMWNITIADYQRDELHEIGIDATTISSAYDDRIFHELPDVERSDDEMLAVGRSFFQKNFAMTLAAWHRMGDERPPLILFGFEPDIASDDRIRYESRPSSTRVNELYNRAALFVQTSRHEGFALPIIEAMAAGCPVITTDSHGNRDFCHDGVNCVIVEHDDVEGLADAIRDLLADPARRERLRTAGLESARSRTWTEVSGRVAAFFGALSASAAR